MNVAERECEVVVSDYYLRLTTEGIRLFSNRGKRHCTFSEVVNARATCVKELTENYQVADMCEHLAIIPTSGDIPLKFTILETSAASLDEAADVLRDALGRPVAFADTVSLMLYDLIVEEAKTEVLTKLGLSSEYAAKYRKILKKTPSNVVPFR